MPRAHTWTQRDGTVIRVRDMTDDHLRAACRMLLRNARRTHLRSLINFHMPSPDECGDGAYDAVCDELARLEEADPDDYVREEFTHMFNATRRRGLHI